MTNGAVVGRRGSRSGSSHGGVSNGSREKGSHASPPYGRSAEDKTPDFNALDAMMTSLEEESSSATKGTPNPGGSIRRRDRGANARPSVLSSTHSIQSISSTSNPSVDALKGKSKKARIPALSHFRVVF